MKSMIRQLTSINNQLRLLVTQLNEEQSGFRWRVQNAADTLDRIEKDYHEVLERDATEDSPYIKPTLTEIK